jgi:carboxypeptidase Taq
MTTALEQLKQTLGEVEDLQRTVAVLFWDQETYMPPGGLAARASQVELLSRLAHDRFTDPRVSELLDRATAETRDLPADSDDASLVRVTRRLYDREVKLPTDLVAEMARAESESQPVWAEARQKSDWKIFEPRMRITVDLAKRAAEAYGYTDRPMQALLEGSEPGVTLEQVEAIFSGLREAIVPLVKHIAQHQDAVDDSVLDRDYDEQQQIKYSLEVVQRLGFDLERGRQDITRHPFCTSFGRDDVRITTRVKRDIRDSCLFSSIHEAGHGMYEQGVGANLDRTPMGQGASSGVHESQSRLWENLVGRSRPFWRHFFPSFQQAFPGVLADMDAERIYRAVNGVRPSYIRVDSDEVTYNLHIMLRTELENDLLEDRLRVEDVPEAWNQKLEHYLGLPAPKDANGCLQDIHWTFPTLGGFVGYTLGNVLSAQIMESVRRDLPDLDEQIERGEFSDLLGWLHTNLHEHGAKFTPNELVERVTGSPLTVDAWVRYIRGKYGELYGLD